MRAEAMMQTGGKSKMMTQSRARNVEALRVGKSLRIAICGGDHAIDDIAPAQLHAGKGGIGDYVASSRLNGSAPANGLVENRGDYAAVLAQGLHGPGMGAEGVYRIEDQRF